MNTENQTEFDPRNVPFREEWRDNVGGIANALPWLKANCTEKRFYHGVFVYNGAGLFADKGVPVSWLYSPGGALMYTFVRCGSSGKHSQRHSVYVFQDRMEIVPEGVNRELSNYFRVYRPYRKEEGNGVDWLTTAYPRLQVDDNRHRMAISPHSLRGQIQAIFNHTPFICFAPAMNGKILCNYVFPDVVFEDPHGPFDYKAFEGVWAQFQEAINPPYRGMPPEDVLQGLLSDVGDAILAINEFFGSVLSCRETMQSMVVVDVAQFESKNQYTEAFVMKSMLGLPSSFSTKE